jgi:hypothetical protein
VSSVVKNEHKDRFGSISDGTIIFGLRVKQGDRLNVSADYFEETLRRLKP